MNEIVNKIRVSIIKALIVLLAFKLVHILFVYRHSLYSLSDWELIHAILPGESYYNVEQVLTTATTTMTLFYVRILRSYLLLFIYYFPNLIILLYPLFLSLHISYLWNAFDTLYFHCVLPLAFTHLNHLQDNADKQSNCWQLRVILIFLFYFRLYLTINDSRFLSLWVVTRKDKGK